MSSRKLSSTLRGVTNDTISRRCFLAAGGAVAVGSLAGCLNQVASSVTNTGASPAAVFAGTQAASMGEFIVSEPHVSRLTPSVSGGQLGDVELEGWVTSSPVMAQNHNSSRSNAPGEGYARDDEDSDGDGIGDADEDDELVAYLGGKPIVAERFTVCLPDAEVPGGDGSIRDAVTPERLIAYLTGESDGDGRVYSWGTPKTGSGDPDPSTDCNDDDPSNHPGAVCGTTPHFVAEVDGPVATGGGLVGERTVNGRVIVTNTPPTAGGGPSMMVCPVEGEPFVPEGLDAWGKRAGGGPPATMEAQGRLSSATVVQVMVRPPDCPVPFPALLYVSRGVSDGQLVYSGGWVIDDSALYEDSVTVLSMVGATQVAGIECCFDYSSDVDGDGFGDVMKRSVSGERALRGARLDSGTVEELVKVGVFSADSFDPEDPVVSDFIRSRSGGGGGGRVALTHVAVDAPVLHLVGASRASDEVKFKAGAELSKSVN